MSIYVLIVTLNSHQEPLLPTKIPLQLIHAKELIVNTVFKSDEYLLSKYE